MRDRRFALAALLAAGGLSAVVAGLVLSSDDAGAMAPPDARNAPVGTARGIFPGRVVWAYDPAATLWNGSTGYWWDDRGTDQAAVDAMVSRSLCTLAGAGDDVSAWGALFRSFNQARGKGNVGYQAGETVAVKINLNNHNASYSEADNQLDASPHMVLALLRQLVNRAGVPQNRIYVYDAVRLVPDKVFNKCRAEFPQVVFADRLGGSGRTAIQWSAPVIAYAAKSWPDGSPCGSRIPQAVLSAGYVINMALLKCHGTAGVTLTAKNHYGSIDGREHWYIKARDKTMPLYNPLVDLQGHRNLGGKTMLFLIDALYGTDQVGGTPKRFQLPPFNNRWSSSLLVSQDPVAIDSVGLDFLASEFPSSYLNNADNYLHEAALANLPPSGTTYDPEGDGSRLASLGVHEHWNSNTLRQYSRNLGAGSGIELVPPLPAVVTRVRQLGVPEGGTAVFGVKLAAAPAGATTVSVSRINGDTDIQVSTGSSLVFTADNFDQEQEVVLTAAEDADEIHGTATIQCAAPGFVSVMVAAAEQDNDLPPYPGKINSGGGALAGGWAADTGFSGGTAGRTSSSVANATLAPMALYQTDRNGTSFRYSLATVPNGTYQVRLHFCEMLARGPGQRVFHVAAEGVRILSNFDIYASAGGRLRALARTFTVTISDGNGLQLDFTRVAGYAQVCGIEVESLGPPPPAILASTGAVTVPEGATATFGVHLSTAPAGSTTVTVTRASGDEDIAVSGGASLVFTSANFGTDQTVTLAAGEDGDTANGTATIQCAAPGYAAVAVTATEQDNDVPPYPRQINCGGGALSGGWAADTGFSGGAAGSTVSSVANATLAPMALYQTDRNAPSFRYNLATVPNGSYQVRLHFCEMLARASGQRVFHVAAEGVRVLSDLDVFAAAGGRLRALARTFTVSVADGNGMQLDFNRVLGYAQVCGIEITPTGARRSAAKAVGAQVSSESLPPDIVLTSEDQQAPDAGRAVVDGDPETIWQASSCLGSWICLGYEQPVTVRQVEVNFTDDSPRGLRTLASENARDWFELEPELELGPVSLNYLWFLFPAAPLDPPPAVRSIEIDALQDR